MKTTLSFEARPVGREFAMTAEIHPDDGGRPARIKQVFRLEDTHEKLAGELESMAHSLRVVADVKGARKTASDSTPNGLVFHPGGDITVQGNVTAQIQEDGSVVFDPGEEANAFAGVLVDAIVGRGFPTPAHAMDAFDKGLATAVGENQMVPEGWAWRRDLLDQMLEPELEFIYLSLLKAVPQ